MPLKYPGQPRGWHQYYGPGKESQPEKPDSVSVEDTAYQGTYHDTVVAGLAAVARAGRQRHAGARRTIRRRHRLGPRQHWCRPTSNGGGYPLLLPDFDRRVGPVNGGA